MDSFVSHQKRKGWQYLAFGIAGFFGVLLVIFLILFLYYVAITQFGSIENREQLAQTFSDQFTQTPGLGGFTVDLPADFSPNAYIYQESPILGDPNAPITILAFIDFECPFCQRGYPIFEQVVTEFDGIVKVVFKHFPVEVIHPQANNASLAAQCAQQSGQFWEYYRLVFERKVLTDSALIGYATELSLPEDAFANCIARRTFQDVVNQDLQDGLDIGVRGTPTYIINNQKLEGVADFAAWRTVILDQLQQSQ